MKEYKLNELTSSQIQYDKNPPKFFTWIIFVFLFGIILLTIVACLTYKTEVVKSTGIISSCNKTYIMSSRQGKIEKIYKESGEYVTEGELLFELDDIEIESQSIALNAKAKMLTDYIVANREIIRSLNTINLDEDLINPFDEGKFFLEYNNIINAINGLTTVEEKKNTINTYILQYENQCFQYEYEYVGLKSQMDAYYELSKDYRIYANSTGYVNYNNELKPGMVIDSNSVGTISEMITDENVSIEVYIDSSFKPFIKENLHVEIIVNGLSQTTYGFLNGTVTYVSKDSIQTDDGVFFSVSIKPDSVMLKNGDQITNLSNGMVAETRIKYESVTWMNWFLNKIGVIDR